MPAEDIAIFLGLMTIIAHFFSDRIMISKGKFLSFATGISVAYIFLYIFPEVVKISPSSSFIFVLAGFSLLRLLEVHIHKHRSLKLMKKELKELHASIFFVYHLFIGVVLLGILNSNLIGGLLFFLPLLFHSTISSASLPELHEKIKGTSLFRFILSLSTLLGVSIAILFNIPQSIDAAVLGFVTGALLYIVIRDSMPKDTKSKPMYFLLGVVLYTILIVFSGML